MRGDSLPKSAFFAILVAAFPPRCTDWREILHGQGDPDAPRLCQISRESVQRVSLGGEKADFLPVSKLNTGSLPLRVILPVKTRICAAEMAVRYAALSACRKVHP